MNKYKTIFLISLLPYAAILLAWSMDAFFRNGFLLNEVFGRVWFDMFDMRGFPFALIAFVALIAYQITYLLKLRYFSNNGEAGFFNNPKQGKISKAFFVLSFIPYALLIAYMIYSAKNGMNTAFFGNGNIVYGIEAAKRALGWGVAILCIIPILPLSIIYQLIFLILKILNKKKSSQ